MGALPAAPLLGCLLQKTGASVLDLQMHKGKRNDLARRRVCVCTVRPTERAPHKHLVIYCTG